MRNVSGQDIDRSIPASRRFLKFLLSFIPNKLVYVISEELRDKYIRFVYKKIKNIGENVKIDPSVVILSPSCLQIGNNCTINHYVHILASAGIVLEDGTWIANHASLISHSHPTNVEYIGDHGPVEKPIYVEKHVWIGAHAVILPGVRLGRSCIVAAGAVVTHDVPPYAIVAGVPARVIRYKEIPQKDVRE